MRVELVTIVDPVVQLFIQWMDGWVLLTSSARFLEHVDALRVDR